MEIQEETYELGTGQVVTCVKSLEDSLAEKKRSDRTLRLGAYGENFVTSTLSTVGYNNLIAISTIYDGLFAKDFETGEILCRVAGHHLTGAQLIGFLLYLHPMTALPLRWEGWRPWVSCAPI